MYSNNNKQNNTSPTKRRFSSPAHVGALRAPPLPRARDEPRMWGAPELVELWEDANSENSTRWPAFDSIGGEKLYSASARVAAPANAGTAAAASSASGAATNADETALDSDFDVEIMDERLGMIVENVLEVHCAAALLAFLTLGSAARELTIDIKPLRTQTEAS